MSVRFSHVGVEVEDLEGPRTLLFDVDVDLTQSWVSVIGSNGSGKSTLLRLVNGLMSPSTGHVHVDGLDTVRDGAKVRSRVGFVFTDPAAQLVMPTPLEDVELSLRRRIKGKKERRAAAEAVLAELGIADLAERSVFELSGGQRQLVALATVLAVDPQVLVLDEPTTLLDLRNTRLLRETLTGLVERRGIRIVCSTHDLDFAALAERTLVVESGRIVADAAPAEAIAAYRDMVSA